MLKASLLSHFPAVISSALSVMAGMGQPNVGQPALSVPEGHGGGPRQLIGDAIKRAVTEGRHERMFGHHQQPRGHSRGPRHAGPLSRAPRLSPTSPAVVQSPLQDGQDGHVGAQESQSPNLVGQPERHPLPDAWSANSDSLSSTDDEKYADWSPAQLRHAISSCNFKRQLYTNKSHRASQLETRLRLVRAKFHR